MTAEMLLEAAKKLNVSERTRLAEQIWESVEECWTADDLPQWQSELLDRRIAEHQADPTATVTWEETKRELSRRKRSDR